MSRTATHPSFFNEAGRPARRAISVFPTRDARVAAPGARSPERDLPPASPRLCAAAGRREA